MLKRLHGEFGEFRRDLASMKMRLSSAGQHQATMAVARIDAELDAIRGDAALIKRRLDLAEA